MKRSRTEFHLIHNRKCQRFQSFIIDLQRCSRQVTAYNLQVMNCSSCCYCAINLKIFQIFHEIQSHTNRILPVFLLLLLHVSAYRIESVFKLNQRKRCVNNMFRIEMYIDLIKRGVNTINKRQIDK